VGEASRHSGEIRTFIKESESKLKTKGDNG
jgi:hypothetical protein